MKVGEMTSEQLFSSVFKQFIDGFTLSSVLIAIAICLMLIVVYLYEVDPRRKFKK